MTENALHLFRAIHACLTIEHIAPTLKARHFHHNNTSMHPSSHIHLDIKIPSNNTPPRCKNPVFHLSKVVIESFKGVSNKWQAHLWRLFNLAALLQCLSFENGSIISLVNLVGREVGGVNVRCQARLEWSSDTTKTVKFDTTEEGMILDFVGTPPSKTVLSVTNHTRQHISWVVVGINKRLANLRIKFSASIPSVMSSGKYRVCRQLTILR